MDKYCGECGSKVNPNEKFCGNCGSAINNIQPIPNNNSNSKKNKMPIWLRILLIILGVILVLIGISDLYGEDSTKENSNSNSPTSVIKETTTKNTTTTKSVEQKKQEENEYKASCKTYNYKDVFRHPENYKGERAKVKGEVIQVMDLGNTLYQLRVNVTKGDYGIYQDTMFITLEKEKFDGRIIEDDIITFWGEFGDLYTYESVLGAEITIPSLQGKYAELSN